MSSFPYKLHILLDTVTSDKELNTIISWLPDGKSFRIHSAEEFERRVLRDFFPRQKKVKSFMRQLQYYNFVNFGDGLFFHPCFCRSQRHLCGQILHQLPTKSQQVCGKSTRPLRQRGRKRKGHSHALESLLEPSLPDDVNASSGSSSLFLPEDQQRHDDKCQPKLDTVSSPTSMMKEVRSESNKADKAQAEKHVNAASPMTSVLPMHQQTFFVTPQVLAQSEMQAIDAARSSYYLSYLQYELMLASILYGNRGLPTNEQSKKDQHPKLPPMNPQSMPWSAAGSTIQF